MCPLGAGDRALYVRLYGDAAAMRHVGAALAPAAAERAFDAVLAALAGDPPAAVYWVLREAATDEAFGLMALAFDARRTSAELGLVLPPQRQDRGYASEAIGGLLPRLRAFPRLASVWTRHREGHAAAAGLMRRTAFAPDGTRDGYAHWRLARAEWPPDAAGPGFASVPERE
nr:GNAT family protein [Luteimonas sp. Y-2-2-4F]